MIFFRLLKSKYAIGSGKLNIEKTGSEQKENKQTKKAKKNTKRNCTKLIKTKKENSIA